MTNPYRIATGRHLSGRAPPRVLLALLFVLAIQVLALSHLVGHSAQGDNGGCVICISAGHAGNALLASPLPNIVLNPADRPSLPTVTHQLHDTPSPVYRSRAPPAFA